MSSIGSCGVYEKYVKRVLDVVFGSLFFILLFWLYIVIAVLVRIKLGSPILFRQDRPGKDEKLFTIIKFRTMKEKNEEGRETFDDDKRMTRFGAFLRSTSLDELPEVFNVIKGDMSFVGPRPLLKEYLPYYTENERKRHSVRPGITGLAQINGRNCVDSWEKRFEYDIKYAENVTFLEDVRIILSTFRMVFTKKGVELGGGIKQGRLDWLRGGKKPQ